MVPYCNYMTDATAPGSRTCVTWPPAGGDPAPLPSRSPAHP
jgi:hypothetical protein